MIDNLPLVTIRCITYNHKNYIKQCLDGFVMQKTNFRFEAIVHDDASTDGTADIVREYAAKYPDIIRPIFQTENQYSKFNGEVHRVIKENVRGKYVAMCEGDDYWTDPYKLQKQVDIMEANPKYSLCFHRAKVLREDGRNGLEVFETVEQGDYILDQVFEPFCIAMASVMVRQVVTLSNPYDRNFIMGDVVLFSNAAKYGTFFCIGEEMSVYRLHKGGISNGLSNSTIVDFYSSYIEYFPEFKDIFIRDYKLITRFGKAITYCITKGKKGAYAYFVKGKKDFGTLVMIKEIMQLLLMAILRRVKFLMYSK